MKIRSLLAMLAFFALAACAGSFKPASGPSFDRDLARPGAVLDATVAASLISGYRANSGRIFMEGTIPDSRMSGRTGWPIVAD